MFGWGTNAKGSQIIKRKLFDKKLKQLESYRGEEHRYTQFPLKYHIDTSTTNVHISIYCAPSEFFASEVMRLFATIMLMK
jgi:hypothetical protein